MNIIYHESAIVVLIFSLLLLLLLFRKLAFDEKDRTRYLALFKQNTIPTFFISSVSSFPLTVCLTSCRAFLFCAFFPFKYVKQIYMQTVDIRHWHGFQFCSFPSSQAVPSSLCLILSSPFHFVYYNLGCQLSVELLNFPIKDMHLMPNTSPCPSVMICE